MTRLQKGKTNRLRKIIFLFFGICLLLSLMACSSLYVTRNNFASPLPVKLILRNDSYGEGHFGAKRSGGRIHKGVDLLADVGMPILAAKYGVVKYARYKKGNGNYVVIDHFWGYKTYYCHLLKITAKEGQWVNAGQVVGYVGKTGNANRAGIEPHLHFEVHKDGMPRDPSSVILI